MSHGIRDGDIIATDNPKFGALTLSQPLHAYNDLSTFSPMAMWATQPAIRAVVDFIVDALALVPFDLYQRQENGGRQKATRHPVQKALQAPGYKIGQRRWSARLHRDMLLYGRWAVAIHTDDDGNIELLRLPAYAIAFTTDSLGRYTEIVLQRAKGGPVTRPLGDIIFDINDVSDATGDTSRLGATPVSVLEGLARETEGLNIYRSQLFRNSAMVPAVIERPKDAPRWTDDAWRRFKEEFSTYKAGGGNAGGTPLLEDGMQLKPVDVFNPRDTEVIETRKLALIEAAQALHIPPELVGAKDGTKSNIEALRQQLYVDVLGAHLGYYEDALNVGLAERIGSDHYIEANLEARLRATFTDRVKAYQSAGGGPWLTRAEIRKRENLDFIDGTDELIVPLNVVEGGLASPNDTGQTNEEDGEPYKGQTLGLHSLQGKAATRPKEPGPNRPEPPSKPPS